MELALTEYCGPGRITVALTADSKRLALTWHLADPGACPGNWRWPACEGLDRADELWRSTCFEFFLGRAGQPGYIELNVSPSGAWNCYTFDDYRAGMQLSEALRLEQVTSIPGQSLSVRLQTGSGIQLDHNPGQWLIAPTVVLEDDTGLLHYFAVSHPEPPDFHNRTHHVPLRPR